jgi:hypothetical protein
VLRVGDARDAQVDLGEVVDRDVLRLWFNLALGLVLLSPAGAGRGAAAMDSRVGAGATVAVANGGLQRFAVGGDQGLDLLRVDALHQVFVGIDQVRRRQQVAGIGPVQRRDVEEFLGALRQLGQHRLEVDGQQAEGIDQQRADLLQLGVLAFLLGQLSTAGSCPRTG